MSIDLQEMSLVQHDQPERVVALAVEFLRGLFSDGVARRPGDLEDEILGPPGNVEMLERYKGFVDPLGSWRDTPFFPALACLVHREEVEWEQEPDGAVWYAARGHLTNRKAEAPE